ncbi:hypothetical protein [Streptomyces sp. NPDC026659]|uniref:hypothetical protein n=1 Tax=Streptomyces sp. NPDC026659 TaxID=3155123 RepID=UPI0034097ECC
MDGNDDGGAWVISDNGKIRGVASNADAARRFVIRACIDIDYRGARFRWTKTHKLFAQRPMRVWAWTGIEIIPAPII